MLVIQITKAKDENLKGTYRFGKNLVHIGSHQDSDLMLPQDEVALRHLFIEVVEDQLIAHLDRDSEEFWVDGKVVTKFKFLSPASVIRAGETEFRVIEARHETTRSKRELLNKNTDELIKGKSPLLGFIKALQENR